MKKLACVLFITLALPVFGALEDRNGVSHSPFVAVAGHTTFGGGPSEWCSPCGCPKSNCACDEGEASGPCGNAPVSQESGDGGAFVLIVAVAFAFWLRLRS
jgi:hypothetical protein